MGVIGRGIPNRPIPGRADRRRLLNSSDRTRTCDPGLMNPLLCQLSYAAVIVGILSGGRGGQLTVRWIDPRHVRGGLFAPFLGLRHSGFVGEIIQLAGLPAGRLWSEFLHGISRGVSVEIEICSNGNRERRIFDLPGPISGRPGRTSSCTRPARMKGELAAINGAVESTLVGQFVNDFL